MPDHEIGLRQPNAISGPERRVEVRPQPSAAGLRVVYLELANTCNSLCTTCPLTFGKAEPEAMLSLSDVRRLIEQAPDLERAVLHGVGESLLNPDLVPIVDWLSGRGIDTCFNTNALLLNRKRAAALVDAGLTDIRISLDAAEPETYEEIRGVRGHTAVVRNLKRMVAARADAGASAPRISVFFTAMHENIMQLPDVLDICIDAGADALVVQRMTYFGEGLATEDQSLFKDIRTRERVVLEQVETAAAEHDIDLVGTAGVTPLEALEDAPHRRGCERPWTTMYVTAQGNVFSCCIAPFTGHDFPTLTLGNVFESALGEIWAGDRYEQVRTGLREGPPAPFCEGCGERWSY